MYEIERFTVCGTLNAVTIHGRQTGAGSTRRIDVTLHPDMESLDMFNKVVVKEYEIVDGTSSNLNIFMVDNPTTSSNKFVFCFGYRKKGRACDSSFYAGIMGTLLGLNRSKDSIGTHIRTGQETMIDGSICGLETTDAPIECTIAGYSGSPEIDTLTSDAAHFLQDCATASYLGTYWFHNMVSNEITFHGSAKRTSKKYVQPSFGISSWADSGCDFEMLANQGFHYGLQSCGCDSCKEQTPHLAWTTAFSLALNGMCAASSVGHHSGIVLTARGHARSKAIHYPASHGRNPRERIRGARVPSKLCTVPQGPQGAQDSVTIMCMPDFDEIDAKFTEDNDIIHGDLISFTSAALQEFVGFGYNSQEDLEQHLKEHGLGSVISTIINDHILGGNNGFNTKETMESLLRAVRTIYVNATGGQQPSTITVNGIALCTLLCALESPDKDYTRDMHCSSAV